LLAGVCQPYTLLTFAHILVALFNQAVNFSVSCQFITGKHPEFIGSCPELAQVNRPAYHLVGDAL
jgi:hypothetical protein